MRTKPQAFFLDGPSASGKSRLKREVLATCPALSFCPRVTTRPPRDSDSDADYSFVSPDSFRQMEEAGKLAAWRHFEFGMSYGLPRGPVDQALAEGRSTLALIDLGTVEQVKTIWPDSVAILLYAPLEHLEQRLKKRPGHNPEHIEERLRNAALVWEKRALYDRVLLNADGRWEETLEEMLAICRPTKS